MQRIARRQNMPGGAVTDVWIDDDQVAVHNYHFQRDLEITKEWVKLIADTANQKTPQKDGLIASVPPGLWWKWRRDWQSGPNQEVLWETYLMIKLNSSEFRKLRAYEQLPMPEEV